MAAWLDAAGHGSLGGIFSGLTAAAGEVVFNVACDMPFLHPPVARLIVARAGEADVVISPADTGYDLVTTFDCLHDMGDPVGAARHVREALGPDGTWLIVEPFAGDNVASNLNPVGRVYYGFSTYLCVPNAVSQDGGQALGAQAGEAAIREVVTAAGFTRFRRAAETPFNLVLEARP